MKELARGAEAIVYEKANSIIKERPKKNYRISELDHTLRTQRTKREASLLQKVRVAHPNLISSTSTQIIMEKIDGEKLRDVLDKKPALSRTLGSMLAELHNQDIIHGDLTTSNILVSPKGLVLIDFGLSFHSKKEEDKAVDIHLFKQALVSKHHAVYEQALKEFLIGYRQAKGYEKILKRIREVELRGRYRKG